MAGRNNPIIQYELLAEVKERNSSLAGELRQEAHEVGSHGLREHEFLASGIFDIAP